MKYKTFNVELKTVDDDKGIISGYASTFGNVDRDGDVFEVGAFSKSLEKLKSKSLQIPMLAGHQHAEIIGGFDPKDIVEDAKGLHVKGKFDLDVQKGREFFSLSKKGFLNSFSIGFSVDGAENFERIDSGFKFKNAELFEISLVAVPANPDAIINSVKDVGASKNLPIADEDTPWVSDEAVKRVKTFTKSDDAPTADYKKAFMFFDGENADNFTAYKLPFADVIAGKLQAVPRALSAIVAAMNGARGGVSIPDADKKRIEGIVNQYFKRMGRDAPFGNDSKSLELLNLLLKLKRLNYERND